MVNSCEIKPSLLRYLIQEQYQNVSIINLIISSKKQIFISLITLILYGIMFNYKNDFERYRIGYIFSHNIYEKKGLYYGIQHLKYFNGIIELVCTLPFSPANNFTDIQSTISRYHNEEEFYIKVNDDHTCNISSLNSYSESASNYSFYSGTYLIFLAMSTLYFVLNIAINHEKIIYWIKKKYNKKFQNSIINVNPKLLDDTINSCVQIKKYLNSNNDLLVNTKNTHEHIV